MKDGKNKKPATTESTDKDTEYTEGETVRTVVAKKRIEELENQLKRALADYQNLEKRNLEERANWVRVANKELLLRLLPVLDTLIIAQKHVRDEGVNLSVKQFLDVLKLEGVEQIETVGHPFDPVTMECIETVSGNDENKVVEELRAGFRFKDGTVLRVAQVRVGRSASS